MKTDEKSDFYKKIQTFSFFDIHFFLPKFMTTFYLLKMGFEFKYFWPKFVLFSKTFYQKLFLDNNFFSSYILFGEKNFFVHVKFFRTHDIKYSVYQVLFHTNRNALMIGVWHWRWPNLFLFTVWWGLKVLHLFEQWM